MRRQLSIFMLLIPGTLILLVSFISPHRVMLASSTVSATSPSTAVVNLALNKPATQSSTGTFSGFVASASLAVDGNTDGNFLNHSVSHTNFENQAWWQVDLGAVGLIRTIKIYNRTDCCSERLIDYYVFVSEVPFNSQGVNDTRNQSEVLRYFKAVQAATPTTITINRPGRYVRVQLSGANYLHLAEVEILGETTNLGQWSQIEFLPDIPVHISLLPSRKLLFWGRDKEGDRGPDSIDDADGHCDTYLWDMSKVDGNERFVKIPNDRTNLFCSGHSFLPNGDLFVAGGAKTMIDNTMTKRYDLDGHGPRDTNIFDYVCETWHAGPSMNLPRWYPSVVTLGNGETLIVTGNYVNGFENNMPISLVNKDTEILGLNRSLRFTPNGMPVSLPNYPFAHLGPDGNVLVVSGTDQNGLSYIPSTNTWLNPTNLDLTRAHDAGTSAMYDKGKILAIGGHTLASVTSSAEMIDLNPPEPPPPTWVRVADMNIERYFATSVVMPDGQVFVVGGSRCGGRNNILSDNGLSCVSETVNGAVMNPEIYNPISDSWSIMARQSVIRMYHSVALLLPDARILVAGGGRPGAYGENGFLGYDKYLAHREAEIFSPPYLFNADGTLATRPTITSSPQSIIYGQSFNVAIGNVPATQIEEVVLVRLPSVTHGLNFDQRRVVLSRTPLNQQTLSVAAPANGNECPPGPYMLFVLSGPNRVPSVAEIVFVSNPAGSAVKFDFDGDRRADVAFWQPSSGNWLINNSSTCAKAMLWGTNGDLPVAADYDGDGKTDIAVWRPSNGNWYIVKSSNSGVQVVGWGNSGDVPVQADYDGDGKADVAVWRPSSGNWFIKYSSTGATTVLWGTNGDLPVPADYDGDGKTDIAIWRPSDGNWYIIKSSNGGVQVVGWGSSGDVPVSGKP
jgi:hypothetical protein